MDKSISLDWKQLLGFDQVSPDCSNVVSGAAKIGIKQMIRPTGSLDSVAMARLTKVGRKNP